MDQFSRAGGSNDNGLRLEPIIGILARLFEQARRICAQVPRLKCGVSHRWSVIAALDHREEQIGIGVTLRRMKNVMKLFHAGGNAHRANMGRAFICPNREFHSAATVKIDLRRRGRAKSAARSPACS